MNASELKYQVEAAGHEQYFFGRQTMRFFGDTMRNYGVCRAQVRTDYDETGAYVPGGGRVVDVWELYRRRPVQNGLQGSACFDAATFRHVHGEPVTE